MNIFECCRPSPKALRYYLDKHFRSPTGQPRMFSESQVFSAYCDYLEGATVKQISERYGMSDNAVRTIVNKKNYRDVTLRADILYMEREQQCQQEWAQQEAE